MSVPSVIPPPYVAGPLSLAPFHAWTLSPHRIGDPASARAMAGSGLEVAALLRRWRESGQVHRDPEPALYLHEYTSNGRSVRGLVGALDVSRRATRPQDRVVWPHEGIHPARADVLADRMAELQVNPAPILLVHRPSAAVRATLDRVRAAVPSRAFVDRSRRHHRLWSIRDPATLAELEAGLADGRALIADGHHRYAAYLRLQSRAPGTAADRGLAKLVDQDDTPLTLGAIHRVLSGTDLDDVLASARAVGADPSPLDRPRWRAELQDGDVVVATDGTHGAAITLPATPGRMVVETVHEVLLPALPRGPSRLTYHHTVEATLRRVSTETGSVALLLPAPDVDGVFSVAESGRLLPEKATSFQPKPGLGVLIRSLPDG